MEQVLSSLRGRIELGDVGEFEEMICDIAKGTVNHSSSAHFHIHKSGYTHRAARKQRRNSSMNTLEL